jgi:hypothetical protein
MRDTPKPGWFSALFRRPAAPTPVEPVPPLPLATSTVAFFRLHTAQGDTLSLPPGTNQLARLKSPDPALAVIAIVPAALPHLCLIAAQDTKTFHIAGDTMHGTAISARILRSNRRGIVRLKQPLGGVRFLTAADAASDSLRFDGPGATMEAAFTLVPVQPLEVSAGICTLSEAFGALAAQGLRQANVVNQLRAGTLPPELAEPILRLLPRDELSDLALQLLEDPQTRALLATSLPQDVYIKSYLPALATWQTTRATQAVNGQLDSPAADEALILPSVNETGAPLGLGLLTLARGHVAPRRGFCVLATARNEGPYLLDWLAYHLSIGFEHVFLYTNDNTDGSDELLALLARHGVITLIRNTRGEKIGVQEKGYAHALTLMPDILDYRWTAVLDLDEYFSFDTAMFDGIADFIALHEAQQVDAIALCWLLFSSRFGDAYTDAPTTDRFTWRAIDVNTHVKSMFRTRMFWHSHPHFPYPTLEGSFNFRFQDGSFHHHPGVERYAAYAANPAAEQAWVSHYLLRSAPEALWKLARGSAAWVRGEDETDRPNFSEFITRTFPDLARPENLMVDRRIEACARGCAAMMERLLALPGIAERNAAIKTRFAKDLKRMAEDFLATKSPPDATPALLRFRDALAASQGIRQSTPLVMPARSRMV